LYITKKPRKRIRTMTKYKAVRGKRKPKTKRRKNSLLPVATVIKANSTTKQQYLGKFGDVKVFKIVGNFTLHLPAGMTGDGFLRWRERNRKQLATVGFKF